LLIDTTKNLIATYMDPSITLLTVTAEFTLIGYTPHEKVSSHTQKPLHSSLELPQVAVLGNKPQRKNREILYLLLKVV